MQAGLIHMIDDEELIKNRDPRLYTDKERDIMKLLSLNRDALVEPIGSFTYNIQQYPSDIDLNQTIFVKGNDLSGVAIDMKNTIHNILMQPNVYFSDFKAGIDERFLDNRDLYIIRWTPEELIRGFKLLPGNKTLRLKDALKMKSVVKLDIIAFVNDRFIEASTFFILQNANSGKYFNLDDNYIENFITQVKDEILKYSTPGPSMKLFKSVKRMWSLARVMKDFETLRKLEPMINSNLSLLGQINADLETMALVIEKARILPSKELDISINTISKKLSTIIDIPLKDYILVEFIDEIKLLLQQRPNNIARTKIIEVLEEMHDYILEVMNRETLAYMQYAKLLPIDSKYLPK